MSCTRKSKPRGFKVNSSNLGSNTRAQRMRTKTFAKSSFEVERVSCCFTLVKRPLLDCRFSSAVGSYRATRHGCASTHMLLLFLRLWHENRSQRDTFKLASVLLFLSISCWSWKHRDGDMTISINIFTSFVSSHRNGNHQLFVCGSPGHSTLSN